jgi:adenine-specific DNA-methyltransferase
MDINAFKLFFPHICEKPSFVICDDQELLFYNGIAVVSNDLQELELLKRILESEIFYQYIKNTTKDYSSGYISMSRNYLKNFGIPLLTEEQKNELIEVHDANAFLMGLYQIDSEVMPIN